jgi:hypothetical protein
MAAQWSRIVNSTTKNYIKEREINVLRNRKLTALLKKRGRITYNWSGTAMDWKVKYKRIRPTPYADGDTLEFSRKDRNKTATLDWRGYSNTDSMSKGEFLQNRGKEAIIKLYSGLAEDLMDDMEDFFGEELYLNGYSAGNQKRIHGIESFMAASKNAGNGAATPSQSNYAGLSCVPGAYGGSWDSGTMPGWPNGKGDTQYDFWSPLVVNYGDTIFPGGSDSTKNGWATNCVEAISFGIIKSKKSKSKKGQLDVIFTDDEMYRRYIAAQRSLQRISVERGEAGSELVSLGFTDVFNQDGTDITWEYGIPQATGYGFNCDMIELRSQQAQLFVPEGPDFDIATKHWRFSIDFFGNCVFNPKFQVKFYNFTNTSTPLV